MNPTDAVAGLSAFIGIIIFFQIAVFVVGIGIVLKVIMDLHRIQKTTKAMLETNRGIYACVAQIQMKIDKIS